MALVFLDTSVLLGGLIDFGPQSAPAQQVMHAIAEKTVAPAATAWHCVLEFYSVATRLPPEYRLSAAIAAQLVDEELFGRLTVHDLPAAGRLPFIRSSIADSILGGRIYDAPAPQVTRAIAAKTVAAAATVRARASARA